MPDHVSVFLPLQKARLARIRIAKASSGAAFVSKKKAAEARLAAQESGLDMEDSYHQEDIFELQHHHLLRCLEKTTVGELYIMDRYVRACARAHTHTHTHTHLVGPRVGRSMLCCCKQLAKSRLKFQPEIVFIKIIMEFGA